MYGYGFMSSFRPASSGVSFDPDAQAFITAASITDPTQQAAVNQLVLDWKNDGIWNDIDAAFPFVGGTSNSNSHELKTAASQMLFGGGVTHTSGIEFNGTNGFGNSQWQTTISNLYDRHFSQYVISLTSTQAWSGNFNVNVFGVQLNTSTSLIQVGCNNLPSAFSQAISANALTCVVVESNTSGKVYNNGNLVHTTPAAINATPTLGDMYIGALNTTSGAQFYHNSKLGFVTYGKALNATKQAALNTSIKNFNTAIGR